MDDVVAGPPLVDLILGFLVNARGVADVLDEVGPLVVDVVVVEPTVPVDVAVAAGEASSLCCSADSSSSKDSMSSSSWIALLVCCDCSIDYNNKMYTHE